MRASLARYWRANVQLMVVLLGIWALAGLGCGVLLAAVLNDAERESGTRGALLLGALAATFVVVLGHTRAYRRLAAAVSACVFAAFLVALAASAGGAAAAVAESPRPRSRSSSSSSRGST